MVGQGTLPLAETVVMSNPPSYRSEISLYLELATPCARENLSMPPLPDARHECFAQLVADKPMSNAEAYRRGVDKPGMKPEVAASMAASWRIGNLYSIRTRDGKVIPFRPRPQQEQVLEMIFKEGLKRIVILKARQLGFSTLLGIICTD
jgi:hypothetical protein